MNRLAKSAFGLMVATMIAKILGFARELVLASAYGTSSYSDAYLVAMNIPTVIFSSIGVALGTIFIPMYYEINSKEGSRKSLEFTNTIFNVVLILCVLLSVLSFLFSEQIVNVFAFGFEKETFELAVNFTKILVIGIISTGFTYIMISYLQINNNFTIPGLISIPYNIIIIISILLSIKFGLYIMVVGSLIGNISQFMFQLPFAIKHGYKYKPYINIKDEYIRKILFLLGPVLIGVAVNQVNIMFDKSIASTLIEGSISALNYSNKLNAFVMGLFILTIGAVIYPTLSKLSSEKNKILFNETVEKSINSIILIMVPISIGAIVLSEPIVRILFERGAFDESATSMTSIALVMYSIGMLPLGLRDIIGKVFYSLQDTKTPMINGVMTMIMNIILNIILVKYIGLAGLPLATSISAIICTALLFRSLKKQIGDFGQSRINKILFKSIISAVFMGGITYFGYSLLSDVLGRGFIRELTALFGSICIGATVYGITVVVLKVEEVNIIIEMIKSKLRKNKIKEEQALNN